MPRLRTQAARDSLLRRVRRQRLKYITILPSLITILNGVCGFAAIVFASKADIDGPTEFYYHRLHLSYFAMAGYMILLAMVADMLDGRVARMSKSTSSFGGQLDSLCDVISFGVAPAFLMVKILEHKLVMLSEYNPHLGNLLERFIWFAAAAFISCAAIRLARFNVENEEDETAHMSFMGLPSPAAAGVVVSLVIFHEETIDELASRGTEIYTFLDSFIIYALPLFVLGAAALMVSRIRYPHIVNQYIKGKKPFTHLLLAILFLGLFIFSRQAAMVLIFCGFAIYGFVKWLYFKVILKKSDSTSAEMETPVQEHPVT